MYRLYCFGPPILYIHKISRHPLLCCERSTNKQKHYQLGSYIYTMSCTTLQLSTKDIISKFLLGVPRQLEFGIKVINCIRFIIHFLDRIIQITQQTGIINNYLIINSTFLLILFTSLNLNRLHVFNEGLNDILDQIDKI